MKLAALVSGGKDSIFAIYKAIGDGHTIEVLITLESENPESYMFHVPNVNVVKLQAKAMGLPLIYKVTKGEKEEELADLKVAITEAKKKYGVAGVVSGAIYSDYQKSRVDKICDSLGLVGVAPLWHIQPDREWTELLNNKFGIIIVAIAAYKMDDSWLGVKVTKDEVEKLIDMQNRQYASAIGEGGEFETLVIDCPLFQKALKIVRAKKIMTGQYSGYLDIELARLVSKDGDKSERKTGSNKARN